jgi:anti-sigma B factor antagonist
MLTVTIQNIGSIATLRCVGRIVVGDEAHILRKAVLSQTNSRTVVLDLARVDAIDGGGMGLLVFLRAWARAAGIELKFTNLTQPVRKVLKLTNLDSVFEVSSPEDALLGCPATVPAAEETSPLQSE